MLFQVKLFAVSDTYPSVAGCYSLRSYLGLLIYSTWPKVQATAHLQVYWGNNHLCAVRIHRAGILLIESNIEGY